ncbi:alpha/beta fold hydrolase [Nocardioides campestrisoli]|uniref:alpha/beta fold hydrolase n=1 Tax=Nocardioides campestrisoli TaxID=2736757 RepID=UPI0015E6AF8F|nr:alpha/beta fold hydrolase [Nocardioides campestrisoli]
MTAFVLVHGAFRGGWAWRQVRPHLVAAGHDVHAPSLIGAGEHHERVREVTGLKTWSDQVSRLILLEDLREVVLVGHSQGGLVTSSVAARIPDRVACVVHLDAAVPAAGERAVDLGPTPSRLPERGTVVRATPVPKDSGEYDEETARWVDARLSASPVGPALDAVPAVPAEVREVFAFCARTPAGYPSTHTRARLEAQGRPFTVLDAGHDAPLSAPSLVAALLLAQVPTQPDPHATSRPRPTMKGLR